MNQRFSFNPDHPRMGRRRFVQAALASVAVFVCLAALYAVLWRRSHDRGPIEQMMNSVWEAALAVRGLGEPAPRKADESEVAKALMAIAEKMQADAIRQAFRL